MNVATAQSIIENFRKGIPPDGFVRKFTVGRQGEIKDLESRLKSKRGGALLIKANYGSGKTHLLRYLREYALESNYIVSYVTLDARSAVRFNRMDQILSAIWRGIEIPGIKAEKGIRPFLTSIISACEKAKANSHDKAFWEELSSHWKWDYSDKLDSPAFYVALRAWATGNADVQDIVQDWMYQSWNYTAKRKELYHSLVDNLRKYFRDPRPDWKFYDVNAGLFNFRFQDYNQSWSCLRDMHSLSVAAGYNGFIIIFDEFEDVIHNIKNINHKQSAFWNLFEFYSGKQFPGMTFYAVTPDFVQKCKKLLLDKNVFDFDYSRFENLPTFQMSPLEVEELEQLSKCILETHGIAYKWTPDENMKATELQRIVRKAASIQIEDRARHTITEVVKSLDKIFQEKS